MAPVATEFEKIINTARERKKNEALADKIFSRGRRQSAPTNSKPQIGGSLASRVGVKKSQPQNKAVTATSSRRRRASVPAGDVNGEWTHDLHSSVNRPSNNNSSPANASLSSRITLPGTAAAKKAAAKKKVARLTAAFDRMETDDSVKHQVNIVKNGGKAQTRDAGMTIRGLAGPFAVMAQNFAPGTTAADIESAMTPVGGEMVSCEMVKTQPFIVVEMAFASREGGEKVIETFNNKTADGRIIKVYPKPGGYKANRNSPFSGRPKPSSQDDLMGDYDNDLMDRENVPPSSRGSSSNNRLQYNDGNKNTNVNKRGRGFQRGSNNNSGR
ncbi:hypothetical protein HDV63DRAFT_384397 [Trichoderma sp. SZMC 28014]